MHSEARLSVVHHAGHSVLSESFASSPFKFMSLPNTALKWGETDLLDVMQMCSSPGFLAGDELDMSVVVQPQAGLYLHNQSFTRILSMNAGQRARQSMHVQLHPNSRLCYLPSPLVLHQSAHFEQTATIELATDCRLIWGEIMASGRHLRDEHFAFSQLSAYTRINLNGRALLIDNIQWQPHIHTLSALGQMEDFSHQSSWYCVNTSATGVDTTLLDELFAYLEQAMAQSAHTVLLGISQPRAEIIVIRGLAHHAEQLQEILAQCQKIVLNAA